MRESRKLAIRTACRIVQRNYNVTLEGDDEEESARNAARHVGQAAFDTLVDEIERALKEYVYMLNEKH
jgi:hypothetical protein